MKSSIKRNALSILAVLAFGFIFTSSVSAQVIQLQLNGTVTSLGLTPNYWNSTVTLGTDFTMIFTFDASAPDSNPNTTVGDFFGNGGLWSSQASVGGYTFSFASSFLEKLNAFVPNGTTENVSGFTAFSAYLLADRTTENGLTNSILLADLEKVGAPLYPNDQLPLQQVPLSNFLNPYVEIGGQTVSGGAAVNLVGEVSSYTITNVASLPLLPPPSVVPEPSTWALFLGAVGVLLFWHRRMRFPGKHRLGGGMAVGLALLSIGSAQAQFTTLASFNNNNGASPYAGLTLSGDILYGTTIHGGAAGYGTVFSVPITGGSPTTLATFNSANGAYPYAGLTLSGTTLYGTALLGGTAGYGTVFSVPLTGGSPTTLATFNSANGAYPYAGLTLSGTTLYGTALLGGTAGYGTVFSVPLTGGSPTTLATFNSANGAYPYAGLTLSGTTLYGAALSGGTTGYGTVFSVPLTGGSLTTLATFNGANGENPYAGLILSGSTLYGTTLYGGTSEDGTVYSVPITGGSPTTLAAFNGTNGAQSNAGLTLSGSTLYGTTYTGGANGVGTVFSVPLTGGSPTTLATFNSANGANPYAGLTLSGNTLYGTTFGGGANGDGTVFSVDLDSGALTTLVTFDGTNGAKPYAGLILSGNTLYGTTYAGGANGYGTVFSLQIQAVPEPSTWALLLGAVGVLLFWHRRMRFPGKLQLGGEVAIGLKGRSQGQLVLVPRLCLGTPLSVRLRRPAP